MNGENLMCILSVLVFVFEAIDLGVILLTGYDCVLHFESYDADSGYSVYRGSRGSEPIEAIICTVSRKPEIVRRVDKLGRCFTSNQIARKVVTLVMSVFLFLALVVIWVTQ